jgi:hypothetical protein
VIILDDKDFECHWLSRCGVRDMPTSSWMG